MTLAISIISLVFSIVTGSIAIYISTYSLKKTLEHSYPVIEPHIKTKKGWELELTLRNIGKSTVYDLVIYFSTGWGNTDPKQLNYVDIVPGFHKSTRVRLPADKKGAVYYFETIIRGKRKKFFGRKVSIPEQITKWDLDREKLDTNNFAFDFLEM